MISRATTRVDAGPNRPVPPGKRGRARIRVSHGPMELGVQLQGGERVLREAVKGIPERAKALLGDVQRFYPVLRLPSREIPIKERWPRVVRRMIEAARTVSESLTPMAAVAGAISDELLGWLRETAGDGIDQILVNNGGDMALFSPREPIRVGIRGRGMDGYEITLSPRNDTWGIATSGWRGRSFSLGIADAVTVIAACGAVADAAATFIANHVDADLPGKVRRRKAAELDPVTDIPDLNVTVDCGTLTEGEKDTALKNGYAAAVSLMNERIIRGVSLNLQGKSIEVGERIINFQTVKGGMNHGNSQDDDSGGRDS